MNVYLVYTKLTNSIMAYKDKEDIPTYIGEDGI